MPARTRNSRAKGSKSRRLLAYDSNISRGRKGTSGRSSKMPPTATVRAEDAPIALAPPGFRTAMEWEGMPCIEFDGRQGILRVFEVDGVPCIFLQTSPVQAQDSAWPRACDQVSPIDAFEGFARYQQVAFANLSFGRHCRSPHEMRALGVVPPFGTPVQSVADLNGSAYTGPSGKKGILRTSTTGQTFLQRHGKRVTWADEVSVQQGLNGPLKGGAEESPLCTVRELTEEEAGATHLMQMRSSVLAI